MKNSKNFVEVVNNVSTEMYEVEQVLLKVGKLHMSLLDLVQEEIDDLKRLQQLLQQAKQKNWSMEDIQQDLLAMDELLEKVVSMVGRYGTKHVD